MSNAESAAAELERGGTQAFGMATDVTSEADVARLVRATMARYGRIDVLLNNAAYFSSLPHVPIEEITVDLWRKVMDINVMGLFVCAREVIPHMKKQNSGRIINISSGTALKGNPGFLHYVTSKGAVIAFTRALAREVGQHNITVNAVAPGLTLSDGVLKNYPAAATSSARSIASRAIPRDEHPDDLVGAVSFLAGDDAAFMTGQTLAVDGGSAML
jgi:NAD(P)-dependent dehydrogenase (short-subunit alcohol dehydrogenase family)